MKEELKKEIIEFIKKNCSEKVIIIDCLAHIEVNCNYLSKRFIDSVVEKFGLNYCVVGNHISNIHSLKFCFGNVA